MERKYNIGDVVVYRKNVETDKRNKFEVVNVYPLEAGEKYFVLKDLSEHWFPENHKTTRFYSTDYFIPEFWTVRRNVLFEKKRKHIIDPMTGQINLKYNPLHIEEDYYIT